MLSSLLTPSVNHTFIDKVEFYWAIIRKCSVGAIIHHMQHCLYQYLPTSTFVCRAISILIHLSPCSPLSQVPAEAEKLTKLVAVLGSQTHHLNQPPTPLARTELYKTNTWNALPTAPPIPVQCDPNHSHNPNSICNCLVVKLSIYQYVAVCIQHW